MKGQTLIEVLVALAVAALIISAISVTVISSLNNAIFSKNQNLATQYAQEGMETMRKLKNSNWNTFNSYGNADGSITYYCLDDGSATLRQMQGDKCGQNIDIFMRQVTVEKSNSDCQLAGSPNLGTKMKVSVFWSDGKCKDPVNPFCNKVEDVSCFNNSNVLPPP